MSRCAKIDVLSFKHSGASVRYDGTFHSSNDKYNVALSIVENKQETKSKDIENSASYRRTSSQQFKMTISCMKNFPRFIQVKIYEVRTERILFEKSFSKPMNCKRSELLINVVKKPTMYVISILTSQNIMELKWESLLGFTESYSDKKELENLSIDIKNLLENNTHSDVIMTDGDKKMYLHKVILSARSSVFEKMFKCQMKENREGLVTIKDIPFDILKVFVNYIYSGTIKIENMNMARTLYVAADKYDVQNLKKICLSTLKSMELNDVLDNLILAHMYDERALKEKALTLIAKNYSTLTKQDNWNKFLTENQSLAIEVLGLRINKLESKLEKLL